MSKRLDKLSKQLAYYLRHKPEDIGLHLDNEGWADVFDLLHKWPANVTFDELREIVETDTKGRYAFGAGLSSIRAVQGHSTEAVKITFAEIVPPATLYHGTAARFVDAIKVEGLIQQTRQFVHLSADSETATEVGGRHGVPVVLRVRTLDMMESGYVFYQAENGVYLTERVPATFIDFPLKPS